MGKSYGAQVMATTPLATPFLITGITVAIGGCAHRNARCRTLPLPIILWGATSAMELQNCRSRGAGARYGQ